MLAIIKERIKALDIKWNDIFAIPWLVFGLFITVESLRLVDSIDHASLSMPLWFYILCFVISTISFILFALFNYKRGYKASIIFSIGALILILFGGIAILIEPNEVITKIDIDIYKTVTSGAARTVHFFNLFFIITGFYTGLYVAPKRIKDMASIKLIIYIVYIFSAVAFIYSLFKDDYLLYFSRLFGSDEALSGVKKYIPVSFFGNSNVYGFLFEICIGTTLLHFAITKQKRWYILTAIYYVLLLLTICRTGIAIITILLLVYFLYKTILLLFNEDKKKKVTAIVILSAVGLTIIGFILFYFFGPYKERMDIIIVGNQTIKDRLNMWNIALCVIKGHPLFYGTGFGVYNSIIFDTTSTEEMFNSVTHNFFLSLLGRVGIVGVICYLFAIGYVIYIIVKGYKKDNAIALSMSFMFFSFFFHSFLEDNYYILIAICMVIMAVDNVWKYQSTSLEN